MLTVGSVARLETEISPSMSCGSSGVTVTWCLFRRRTPDCVDIKYDLGVLEVLTTHPGVEVSAVWIHTAVPPSKEC